MRKLIALGSLALVSLPLVAAAQPPPPPPPPPGGGGAMPGDPPSADEPKMRVDAGIIVGIPQGDLDEADTSPGINLQFGYTVIPNVSVLVGLRYFVIQIPGGSEVDLSNWDIDFGARYTMPLSGSMKGFGEAMLIYSTVTASFMGESESESGIGFGARAGAMFNVSGNINVGGALSYTTADINDGTAAWLGVEGFASFGF